MSKNQWEEKNPRWKGDKVGYHALHSFVRARIEKPSLCMRCKVRPAYDLANKSGEYKRHLTDWEYLCRKCHMEGDGRAKVLGEAGASRKLPTKVCIGCGVTFHRVDQRRAKFCNRACAYKNFSKALNNKKHI